MDYPKEVGMQESFPADFISTDSVKPFVARPWSPLYIGVIAYFCLLLPGVLLMSLNYRRMQQLSKARYSLLIGVPLSVVYLGLLVYLPESADWALKAAQMALAFGLAAVPYNDYRNYHAKYPGLVNASLIKPALLSLIFPLTILGGDYLYSRHREHEKQQMLSVALEAYRSERYREALNTLKAIRREFPAERLGYINSAIAYEAVGQKDSARILVVDWLKQAPNDEDARALLRQFNSGS